MTDYRKLSPMSKHYAEIQRMFGRDPSVQVFSPTQYRVSVPGWHLHKGACYGRPCGDGRSLESACAALLSYLAQPASWLAEGDNCDHVCAAKYGGMADKKKAAKADFWAGLKDGARQFALMPAWKRGLPPCEDERCEREYQHEGKHRRAKPVEYEEWT